MTRRPTDFTAALALGAPWRSIAPCSRCGGSRIFSFRHSRAICPRCDLGETFPPPSRSIARIPPPKRGGQRSPA